MNLRPAKSEAYTTAKVPPLGKESGERGEFSAGRRSREISARQGGESEEICSETV